MGVRCPSRAAAPWLPSSGPGIREGTGMNALLEGALDLLRFGWSMLPIQPRGKTPLVSWAALQGCAAEEEVVRAWWKRWPDANVGVVTGPVSDIVVVDVDGAKGAASLKEAGLALPQTVSSATGRGWHVFFKHPGWRVPSRAGLLPGVDVRGDGGNVVAPPSVHASGRVYSWVRGRGPREVELAELSGQLCELLKGAPLREGTILAGDGFLEGVAEGERNNRAAALAGLFVSRGFTRTQTTRLLLLWNSQNRPPLDEGEISRVVTSIASRHAKRSLE